MFKAFDRWLRISYKSSKLIRFLINRIKTSFLFWKFRHIFHENIWQNYLNTYCDHRRDYYSNFIKEKNLKNIFEFGCASAPNLMNIYKSFGYEKNLVGYDINKEAIRIAKKNFNKKNSEFISEINKNKLEKIQTKLGIDYFDLVIFDRVLYLLSEKNLKLHLSTYSNYYDYILIDDFQNIEEKNNGAYFTKNYIKILNSYNFKLINIEKSEHKINSIFFEKYSKRILFRKNY